MRNAAAQCQSGSTQLFKESLICLFVWMGCVRTNVNAIASMHCACMQHLKRSMSGYNEEDEAHMEELTQMFKVYDVNGDGKVEMQVDRQGLAKGLLGILLACWLGWLAAG